MLKEQLQQKNIDYVEARKANEAKVEMIKSLKAEVERLTAFTTRTIIPNEELKAENSRLKAEVERLTPLLGDIVSFDEYHKLLQQVERLTKAGDWVMSHWSSGDGSDEVRFCQALLKWKNAKEGKQP